MLIRCNQHSFDNESQIHCTTHNSAANASSLQKMSFRQRMLIHCSRHSFGSESQFRYTTHNLTANANSVSFTASLGLRLIFLGFSSSFPFLVLRRREREFHEPYLSNLTKFEEGMTLFCLFSYWFSSFFFLSRFPALFFLSL